MTDRSRTSVVGSHARPSLVRGRDRGRRARRVRAGRPRRDARRRRRPRAARPGGRRHRRRERRRDAAGRLLHRRVLPPPDRRRGRCRRTAGSAPAATTSSTASRSSSRSPRPTAWASSPSSATPRRRHDRPLKVTLPGPYTLSGRLRDRAGRGLPRAQRRGRGVRADPARASWRASSTAGATYHPDRRPVAGHPPRCAVRLRGAVQRRGRAGRRAGPARARTCASATTSAGRWRGGPTGRCSTRCSRSGSTSSCSSSPTARWPRSRSWPRSPPPAGTSRRASIDVKNYHLETADEVAERIDAVLAAGVPAERLTLVPDCGFSQTARWATRRQAAARWSPGATSSPAATSSSTVE